MLLKIYNLDDEPFEKLIEVAISEYLDIFYPEKLSDDYKIDVSFHDKIDRKTFQGQTEWVDTHIKPKHCLIKIRKTKNKSNMLSVIAHEIVHVKQMFNGEVIDDISSESDYIWKNKSYNIYENYYLSPWEIEANGYEVALYNIFIEKYDLILRDIQNDNMMALSKIEMKRKPKDE